MVTMLPLKQHPGVVYCMQQSVYQKCLGFQVIDLCSSFGKRMITFEYFWMMHFNTMSILCVGIFMGI